MEHTIEAWLEGVLVFHSNGKWLYPLFELERFLKFSDYDPSDLLVKDKIVGRAAALLLIYFGVRSIAADVLSKPGQEALETFKVRYEYGELVDRIACQTEEMLWDECNPGRAYEILLEKAGCRTRSL
ncbi:MAG: DUF1893 domain-containing protein [Deltaproteobacteria bacterium]|nr:DUF1893 domain-containing protein [Deltaproteobacteria bacterium]